MSDQTPIGSAASSRRSGILKWFAPAPAIRVTLTEPAEIDDAFRRWRWRVLLATIIGYALFYFVRKNLSVAMPVMGKDLGIPDSAPRFNEAFVSIHVLPEPMRHPVTVTVPALVLLAGVEV